MILQKQIDTVNYLKADPLLQGCTIVAATKGNLAAEIDEALGRLGVVITIEPASGRLGHSQGNVNAGVNYSVTITENVLTNRTSSGFGKTAEELMEHVCVRLSPKYDDAPITATGFDLVEDLDEFLVYEVSAVSRGKMEAFNDG